MITCGMLRSPILFSLLPILVNACTPFWNGRPMEPGPETRSTSAAPTSTHSPSPAPALQSSPTATLLPVPTSAPTARPTRGPLVRTPSAIPSAPVASMSANDCRMSSNTSEARKSGWSKSSPVVSPDGKLAAVSDNSDSGNVKLIVTGVDGSKRFVLDAPVKGVPLASPVWSPDSRRLVVSNIYLSQPGGGEIFVMNADGSGLAKIASYVGYHDILAWSPDSGRIAFTNAVVTGKGSGTQVTDYRIYFVAANGSSKPQAVAEGCDPIWQR